MKALSKQYLEEEYSKKNRSTVSIANEHNMYPNQIRRLLKKYGIAIRTNSDAQKINIQNNGHPMEGRERTEEEKAAISQSIQQWLESLTPEEAKKLKEMKSKVGKSNWSDLDKKERTEMLAKMRTGARASVNQGSKNENTVASLLGSKYKILQRTTYFTGADSYEIDIALPNEKVAIEWDGATHFSPIFGAENLLRVQNKDKEKDKLLLGQGWTVIRCRDHSTSPSNAFCRRAAKQIEDTIVNGKKNTVHILDAK